jgi:hypothetical protein
MATPTSAGLGSCAEPHQGPSAFATDQGSDRLALQDDPTEQGATGSAFTRFEGSWSDSGDPYWGGLQMDQGIHEAPTRLRSLLTQGMGEPLDALRADVGSRESSR